MDRKQIIHLPSLSKWKNFLAISVLLLSLGFIGYTEMEGFNHSMISTGPGPEDIVLDTGKFGPRLLVSTCSRRDDMSGHGEIEEIRINNLSHRILPRYEEPEGLVFRPHGIYLAEVNAQTFLYVISHDDVNNYHPVIRYFVHSDFLVFDRLYHDSLLVSPNALTVFGDGTFMVCNDAERRGNRMELILRKKKATVLFADKRGKFSIAAEGFGMPAGINHQNNIVYLSAATENKVYSFQLEDGKLTNKQKICRIKGPDNLRWHGSDLLVACHEKSLRFIRHTRNSKVISPTKIYSINTTEGTVQTVFENSGELMSAGSVAIIYENYLFGGQIFEPGILVKLLDK